MGGEEFILRGLRFRAIWSTIIIGALIGLTLSVGPADASILRQVSTTGNDVGDCTVDPCRTIGYAIGQSVSGDTIKIAAGTYTERVAVDRSLSFRGAGAASTIIDGSKGRRVMMIRSRSASLTVTISDLDRKSVV